MGDGFVYNGPPFQLPANTPRGANNGTSLTAVTKFVVLGQDVGDVANPAILLSSRQIPMNGFNLYFTGPDDGSGNLDSIIVENGGILSIRRNSSVTTGPSINFLDYDDGSTANITYSDLIWRFDLGAGQLQPLLYQVGSMQYQLQDDTGITPMLISPPTYTSGAGGPVGVQIKMGLNAAAGVPRILDLDITDSASSAATKLVQLNVNAAPVFTIDKIGNTVMAGTIQTEDPGSGVGTWKIGSVVAGAVALDAANYVEVEINGSIVKLLKAV